MKEFIKQNWFKIGIIVLLFVAILGYWRFRIMDLQNKQNNYLNEQSKSEVEKSENRKFLDGCMLVAESEWENTFKLNSDPVPGEEGVRQWKSLTLQKNADQKLKDDKELCLKQYPQK